MSMINWDEFEHIHVIKKLRHILGAWWNCDIIFTDERGHLKGFDTAKMAWANPAVGYLCSKESAQANLGEMVAKPLMISGNQTTVFPCENGIWQDGILEFSQS